MGMEPSLQYARTADGVSIAFWTLGDGERLVYLVGGPWNHIELWEVPECRWWRQRPAAGSHRLPVPVGTAGPLPRIELQDL